MSHVERLHGIAEKFGERVLPSGVSKKLRNGVLAATIAATPSAGDNGYVPSAVEVPTTHNIQIESNFHTRDERIYFPQQQITPTPEITPILADENAPEIPLEKVEEFISETEELKEKLEEKKKEINWDLAIQRHDRISEKLRLEREVRAEAERSARIEEQKRIAAEQRAIEEAKAAELAQSTVVRQQRQQSTPQAVPPTTSTAPAAVPAQAPVYSGGVYENDALRDALAASPWPQELWSTVERVIQCESSGNAGAVGPLGHRGLMQVDPDLHGAVPGDAVGQLAQGYDVYKQQGWGAWECY